MTQVTVKQLADEVKTPVERLLQQMREAGLPHTAAEEHVTDSEKQSLLTHLKSSHKAKVEEPRKITLQRKTTSTLRVAGSKSISVEVRKRKFSYSAARKKSKPSANANWKNVAQ
jgi:Bacterial translation initiation factor IF-2 associated region./Translation initiation factor IF-2, N-terminal region.